MVSPPAAFGQICANGGPNLAPFNMQEFVPADVGTPMLKTTFAGPDSRCNDGTPAVMYIRPASAHYSGPTLPAGVAETEKWVILFLGGGGCADEDACWDRWCGLTGYDRAGKMSTAGAYDAIFGLQGMFKRNPAINAYAGYNQVVLYYCSSDNWIGSEVHQPAVTSGGVAYDIEFNGEAIVRDAFATLLAGSVGADAGPAATDQINHITTPVFLRQDINDTLLAERYAHWGLYPSAAAFMDGTAQQLGQMAFGPVGLEAPPVAPGVAGPKCNRHVSVLSNAFFNDRVDPGGLSFHDLLVNWRGGGVPSKEIQVDFNAGPPYTPSICP